MERIFKVWKIDYLNKCESILTSVLIPLSINDSIEIIQYAENQLNSFKGLSIKFYKVKSLLN